MAGVLEEVGMPQAVHQLVHPWHAPRLPVHRRVGARGFMPEVGIHGPAFRQQAHGLINLTEIPGAFVMTHLVGIAVGDGIGHQEAVLFGEDDPGVAWKQSHHSTTSHSSPPSDPSAR